jgi:hypothetical protein
MSSRVRDLVEEILLGNELLRQSLVTDLVEQHDDPVAVVVDDRPLAELDVANAYFALATTSPSVEIAARVAVTARLELW